MKIKQTIKSCVIAIVMMFGAVSFIVPAVASAVTSTQCPDPAKPGKYISCSGNNGCGVDTEIIKCTPGTPGTVKDNGIWSLLLTAINILTAAVGLVAIAGIVYASILYTTAGGNTEQVKKAIDFIRNVVIGIVAYALMFAVLNFIIPGGLFD